MPGRKDNGIAEMQERYITARKMNMWPTDAARWAGYKDPIKAAKRLESENIAVMEAAIWASYRHILG